MHQDILGKNPTKKPRLYNDSGDKREAKHGSEFTNIVRGHCHQS